MTDELYEQVIGDIAALEEQIDTLQQQLDELEQLRERVNELDARTDILQLVENSDDLEGRGRSIAILQHMQRKANRHDLDQIVLTQPEVEEALHYPDIHRTTFYTDMRRCVRLVGEEFATYRGRDAGMIDKATITLKHAAFQTAVDQGRVEPLNGGD